MTRKANWLSFKKTKFDDLQKVVKLEFDNGYSLNVLHNQLPFTIGRAPDCNLVVASSFVSRTHCTIEAVDDEIHIVDQSSNGTFIDERLLQNESVAVKHLMHLLFGGEFMLIITPYDGEGVLITNISKEDAATKTQAIAHGVLIVDVCDST